MLDHDPFGTAGGARREDDIGKIFAGHGHARSSRFSGFRGRVYTQRMAVRRQRAGQVRGRYHQAGSRVLEHERDSLAGVGGIHRHIGSAGLEDAKQTDQHLDRPIDVDADHLVGFRAVSDQRLGQMVGAPIQFAVGERAGAVDKRHRIGRAIGLRFEGLVHTVRSRQRFGGIVPDLQRRSSILRWQPWQVAEPGLGVVGNRDKNSLHQVGDTLDGGRRKTARIVGQLEGQLGTVIGHHVERKIGLVVEREVATLPFLTERFQVCVVSLRIEDDDGVKEGLPAAHLADAKDIDERGVFVLT